MDLLSIKLYIMGERHSWFIVLRDACAQGKSFEILYALFVISVCTLLSFEPNVYRKLCCDWQLRHTVTSDLASFTMTGSDWT